MNLDYIWFDNSDICILIVCVVFEMIVLVILFLLYIYFVYKCWNWYGCSVF